MSNIGNTDNKRGSWIEARASETARESRHSFVDYAGQIKVELDKEIFIRKSQQNIESLTPSELEKHDPHTARKKTKKKEGTDDLKRELKMTEHIDPLDQLIKRLKTNDESGMSENDYNESYTRYGPNKMTPPPTTPEWIKFLKQISGGFALLLWAGGILCFISFAIQSNMSDVYFLYIIVIFRYCIMCCCINHWYFFILSRKTKW